MSKIDLAFLNEIGGSNETRWCAKGRTIYLVTSAGSFSAPASFCGALVHESTRKPLIDKLVEELTELFAGGDDLRRRQMAQAALKKAQQEEAERERKRKNAD